MMNAIKNLIGYISMSPADKYLNASHNIEDLERRMREIERGKAPFQIYYKF